MQDNKKKPQRVVYDYEYDLKRQAKSRNDIKRVDYTVENANAFKQQSINSQQVKPNNAYNATSNKNIHNNSYNTQSQNSNANALIKNTQQTNLVNEKNNINKTNSSNFASRQNKTNNAVINNGASDVSQQKFKSEINTPTKKAKILKGNFAKNNSKQYANKNNRNKDKVNEKKIKKSKKHSQDKSIILSDAKKQRKKRRTLMASVLVLTVITGALLSFYVLFRIDTIEIIGETQYSNTQIINASGIKNGDNLFLFNKQNVANNMQIVLPYLQNITITRTIPGKIKIQVSNAVPCYYIVNGNSTIALSEQFVILETNFEDTQGLTEIKGVSEIDNVTPGSKILLKDEEQLDALLLILTEIEKNDFLNISYIDLQDVINIKFMYENRVVVLVGSIADANKKIEFAKYLLTTEDENGISKTEQGTLDVSTRDAEGRLEASWIAGVTM